MGNPDYQTRSDCPYVEAFIHELNRLASISQFGVPHCANKDFTLTTKDGSKTYFIPKGTQVFGCIRLVMHDERNFPNPSEFDPERFIQADGTFKPHPKVR